MSGARTVGFGAALQLRESETGTTAEVPESWSQGRATYGGLVGALLARAVAAQIPLDRQLRSALIDFIAPVAPGEVTLVANVLRAGRTLTHAEARLMQGDDVMAVFTGVYATRRRTSLQLVAPSAPALAPWHELPRLPYIENVMPRFAQHFEFRVPSGRQLFSGQARPQVGGYVRHAGGGPIDAPGLLGLIDAWPPAFMPALTRPSVASSVTWMVDIVADVAPAGTQSDAFYRYEAEPVAGDGGYASCDARLWDQAGQLIAVSRQLVAEFS